MPAKAKKTSSKGESVSTLQLHEKDTGSSRVQVATLTERINALESHFKTHPKDKHSKTGLLKMIGKRRKHLQYLKNSDESSYKEVIEKLNLRK